MEKGTSEKWLKRIFLTIWIQWVVMFLFGLMVGFASYPADESILFELQMLNNWHWAQDDEKVWFHEEREGTKFTGRDFLDLNRELHYRELYY